MTKQLKAKKGSKKTKYTEKSLVKIADRYYGGETYKQIMASGVTRRKLKTALDMAATRYHIDSEHFNIRKLIAISHHSKDGKISAADVRKYTGWKNTTYDYYEIRALTLDDFEEMYPQDEAEEAAARGAYIPVVLVGVA